jgi:UDP-N-acetylmuramoylalanine--D-glutamate ligase
MMREPAFALLQKPAAMDLRGKLVLVLGLGDSGLSAARWVARQGGRARVADTRRQPPRRGDFSGEFHGGAFAVSLLADVDLICISPGLSLEEKLLVEANQRAIPIVGDVELFAWQLRSGSRSAIGAVTGTNGKTTVAALAGQLLRAAGIDCEVAGNIGPAALAALGQRMDAGRLPAAWVLELSSYQLETTWSLAPDAAAVLNVSEDHLDRYARLEDYAAAKARILSGAAVQILNRDDPRSMAMAQPGSKRVTFGLDVPPAPGDFGLRNGFLVEGDVPILAAGALPIHGSHNVSNALAACALARALGAERASLAEGLRTFRGLAHRVQLVATLHGVDWYDDSKGTNVGATVAALNGLGRRAVLIAGGEGKGQDFGALRAPAERYARTVLLIGRDAPLIERALRGLPVERCESLEAAVERAAGLAQSGEAVLLSPACASFDMFRDYKHRGEAFVAAVKGLDGE